MCRRGAWQGWPFLWRMTVAGRGRKLTLSWQPLRERWSRLLLPQTPQPTPASREGRTPPAWGEQEEDEGLGEPAPSAAGEGQEEPLGEDELRLLRKMRAALPLEDFKTAAELRAGIAGRSGAERSQWLEDYFERQMAVLESDHLDNVWSKGRRYLAKEARLGADISPIGTAAGDRYGAGAFKA